MSGYYNNQQHESSHPMLGDPPHPQLSGQYQQPQQQPNPYTYQPAGTEMTPVPPSSPDKDKNAPPTYYNVAPVQSSPQPYYETPGQQQQQQQLTPQSTPGQLNTIITTTTTSIPHYPYIPGVVDLIPPSYLTSPIPREILQHATPLPYTREVFEMEEDKKSCCTCCEGVLTMLGPLGVAMLAVFVVLTILHGMDLWFMLAPFSAIFILAYVSVFIFCTYICCGPCCSTTQCDQVCLQTPYFTTVCRGNDDITNDFQAPFAQLTTDIPQLIFAVRCSHTTGSGKNRRTVVTYNSEHSIPILHFKWVGIDGKEFLNSLDDFASGDVAIRFIPRFILQPEQADYIIKFKELVYQVNRTRDAQCVVTPFIRCHNPNPIIKAAAPGTIPEKVRFSPQGTHSEQDIELYTWNNDADREKEFRRGTTRNNATSDGGDEEKNLSEYTLNVSTSLGLHTLIYQSNGQSSNACLRCLTSPFLWCIGMLTCFASCCLCIWHARFKQVSYHSNYHVLFPKYEDVVGPYTNKIDSFVLAPPQINPNSNGGPDNTNGGEFLPPSPLQKPVAM